MGYDAPTFTRQMPAWMFAGAPRFHDGGYLAPDERPAILQTGETVLSRRETSVYHQYFGMGGILGAAGLPRYHDGGMVDDLMPISPMPQPRGAGSQEGGGSGGDLHYNPTYHIAADPSTGKPAVSQDFLKQLDKRNVALIRAEIANQNRYRGINNPG